MTVAAFIAGAVAGGALAYALLSWITRNWNRWKP